MLLRALQLCSFLAASALGAGSAAAAPPGAHPGGRPIGPPAGAHRAPAGGYHPHPGVPPGAGYRGGVVIIGIGSGLGYGNLGYGGYGYGGGYAYNGLGYGGYGLGVPAIPGAYSVAPSYPIAPSYNLLPPQPLNGPPQDPQPLPLPPGPGGANNAGASGGAAPATVTVISSDGATVTFDGIDTNQAGTRHSFTTRPISPGTEKRVSVKVDGPGGPATISVGVRAGEKATVDMRR